MGMRYEDLLDLAHLHIALLHLMLRRLPAVEQPDIPSTSKSECKSRMVARRRRLRRSGSKEGYADILQSDGRHRIRPGRGHRRKSTTQRACPYEIGGARFREVMYTSRSGEQARDWHATVDDSNQRPREDDLTEI